MILSNILLGVIIFFFITRFFLAMREEKKKHDKICLISKKTGEVVELTPNAMVEFLNKEIQADFTKIAKIIFTRVAESFAKGRLGDAKNYLSEKVVPIFEQAISEREKLHQRAEFVLIGFKDVHVLQDAPTKKVISFTTEQVNLLKDEQGNIIEGDPLYISTVTENWTFIQKKADLWIVNGIENKEAHFA